MPSSRTRQWTQSNWRDLVSSVLLLELIITSHTLPCILDNQWLPVWLLLLALVVCTCSGTPRLLLIASPWRMTENSGSTSLIASLDPETSLWVFKMFTVWSLWAMMMLERKILSQVIYSYATSLIIQLVKLLSTLMFFCHQTLSETTRWWTGSAQSRLMVRTLPLTNLLTWWAKTLI